jgi:hypothetical protein
MLMPRVPCDCIGGICGTASRRHDVRASRSRQSRKERNLKYKYIFAIGMALCLISCTNGSTSPGINDILHSPVTTNTTNSFTFTIDANQYSDNSQSTLTFFSDSLVVTLSSTGYFFGQAIFSVSDSSNAIVFSDTVRSNKTIAIAHLKTTRPRHCSINISNLTAKLAFAVVGQ